MNMTNINNDLAAGKDVRIDFKQMQNFGECTRRAKQSGSEIILFNIDGVQPSILAQYTSQAPGQVTLERVFPADFGTQVLSHEYGSRSLTLAIRYALYFVQVASC